MQRRAVRMISGLASNDYPDRLAELCMETLEERRHRMDMARLEVRRNFSSQRELLMTGTQYLW